MRCRLSRKEAVKLVLFALFMSAWYFYYSYMSGVFAKMRDKLNSFPLRAVLPVYLAISAFRKLVPPCYYMAPLGTIFTIYLADKEGVYIGALVYQLVKLQDIMYFVLVRNCYSSAAESIFEEGKMSEKWDRWLSSTFIEALRLYDQTWRGKIVGHHWLKQGLVVCAFGICWGMEDYISLFWMATRSQISVPVYSIATILSVAAEYTKTAIKMRIYIGAADAMEGDGSMFNIGHMKWYEILCGTVFTVTASVYVWGSNLVMIYRAIRARWCDGRDRQELDAAAGVATAGVVSGQGTAPSAQAQTLSKHSSHLVLSQPPPTRSRKDGNITNHAVFHL